MKEKKEKIKIRKRWVEGNQRENIKEKNKKLESRSRREREKTEE